MNEHNNLIYSFRCTRARAYARKHAYGTHAHISHMMGAGAGWCFGWHWVAGARLDAADDGFRLTGAGAARHCRHVAAATVECTGWLKSLRMVSKMLTVQTSLKI